MTPAVVLRLLFWLWLAGAFLAAHHGLLVRLPPAGQTALVLALAAGAVSLTLRLPALAAWLAGLETRVLVLPHVLRVGGVYLVWRHLEGELPRAFILPAGIGEAVVAALALPVALAPLADAARERAIRIWAVAGLLNLVLVLAALLRLNLAAPLELRALAGLPLGLYPLFFLPLALAANLLVLRRAFARVP